MKTKNISYFKKKILIIDLLLLAGALLFFKPFVVTWKDTASAQELDNITTADKNTASENTASVDTASADTVSTPQEPSYPYVKTFTISAYYSPLSCQNRYATGSFSGDVRLNGEGVHSADGSLVYPGMVAAPKTYAFGSKMDIPGIGIVAVHDRGGAIVSGNGSNAYDRLDVWMGYGDKGLTRALNWGKRTMDVTVYGVNEAISEQVTLGDYSPDEGNQNDCETVLAKSPADSNVTESVVPAADLATIVVPAADLTTVVLASESSKTVNSIQPELEELLVADLKFGDTGDRVRALQNQLKKLNFYRTEVTGNFGEVTKHAVYKFQQSEGLVAEESSPYAGVFGPKTRDRMNELLASKNYNQIRIAQATNNFQTTYLAQIEADRPRRTLLSMELKLGMRGPEVAELQKFLKAQGFFDGVLITQYFGPVTKEAVLNFQKAHKIVNLENDTGAGHVGPATLEMINTLS